jgi:hypothetical protein
MALVNLNQTLTTSEVALKDPVTTDQYQIDRAGWYLLSWNGAVASSADLTILIEGANSAKYAYRILPDSNALSGSMINPSGDTDKVVAYIKTTSGGPDVTDPSGIAVIIRHWLHLKRGDMLSVESAFGCLLDYCGEERPLTTFAFVV